MSVSQTAQLDELFRRWEARYPEKGDDFCRDGIVDEDRFSTEPQRLLFVLKEPNSSGKYEKYRGWDLRKVWGEEALGKEIDVNIAAWVRALCDGESKYQRLERLEAANQLRRAALINLKKIGGTGEADHSSISIHAWNDRDLICEQVKIIDPHVIVACGADTNCLLRRILTGDLYGEFSDEDPWTHDSCTVLPANHPSLRPKDAEKAFTRLIDRAKTAGVIST